MNTKSLIAAIAGVLMVGATTAGAGLALIDEEPNLAETDPAVVQPVGEDATSEYATSQYEEYEDDNEGHDGYEESDFEDDDEAEECEQEEHEEGAEEYDEESEDGDDD